MLNKKCFVTLLLVTILLVLCGRPIYAQVIKTNKPKPDVIESNGSYGILVSGTVDVKLVNRKESVVKVYVEPPNCGLYLQDLEKKYGEISFRGDWNVFSYIGVKEQEADLVYKIYAIVVLKKNVAKLPNHISNLAEIKKYIQYEADPVMILRKATSKE